MPRKITTQWDTFQTLSAWVLPKRQAGVLSARYQHWELYKGTQWVVDRLKAIFTAAKLHINGRHASSLEVLRENCIKVSPNGIPSGVEGALFLRAISEKPRTRRKAFAILRGYTGLYLDEMSEAQVSKSRNSINAPYGGFCPKPAESIAAWRSAFGVRDGMVLDQKLELGCITDLRATSSYPNETLGSKELPYESMVASLMSRGFVPKSLLDYYGKDFAMRQVAQGNQSLSGSSTLGKIVVLQEGGAKGRVICSPNAWIQYYMYPLHQALDRIISKEEASPIYGVSCVKDQLRGVYLALQKMEENRFISSVDLSSATDRFPLWLQRAVLTALGLHDFGEIFKDLSGPYDSPDGEHWTYRTGQPMGVYASFPLFHLTHLYTLRWCCKQLGLDSDEKHFAVLGDDVLIFDERLDTLYKQVLQGLDVPVSETKSYTGHYVDFAGFSLSKGQHPYRPYKWSKGMNLGPVIMTMATFAKSVKGLSKWWSKNYSVFTLSQGLRDLTLAPLVPVNTPVVGQQTVASHEYFMSLASKLEAKSSVPHINSLIPPVLLSRMDGEFRELIRDERPFGIDPLSFKDRGFVWSEFDIFSSDPLIRAIKQEA